ncbi:hypothetical protein GCM10010485_80970 [Streptosporangium carneum]
MVTVAVPAAASWTGIVTGAMRAEAPMAPAARAFLILIMRLLHGESVAPWATPGRAWRHITPRSARCEPDFHGMRRDFGGHLEKSKAFSPSNYPFATESDTQSTFSYISLHPSP